MKKSYSKPILIGLCGQAGSGKDTLAEQLVLTDGYTRLAFADPLKNVVAHAYGVAISDLHDQDGKAKLAPFWGLTHREMLQHVGTLFREHVSESHWLDRFRGTYTLVSHEPVVVADVRFDNEAKLIRDLGGMVIRIERENYRSPLTPRESTHPSEHGLNENLVDIVLANRGTKRDLYENFLLALGVR